MRGAASLPSNPTRAGKPRTKEPLTETFVFRCTAAEKAQLRAKAEAAGLPAATLLREALGLTEARRRKPIQSQTASVAALHGLLSEGSNYGRLRTQLETSLKLVKAAEERLRQN